MDFDIDLKILIEFPLKETTSTDPNIWKKLRILD